MLYNVIKCLFIKRGIVYLSEDRKIFPIYSLST